MRHPIIVICEGRSELRYLQRLRNFLDQQRRGLLPFVLIPRVAGSGFFDVLCKALKAAQKDITSHYYRFGIWTDYDIYRRDENKCMTLYRERRAQPSAFPTIRFSYHNFEDFLMLHCPEDHVQQWRGVLAQTLHVTNPLNRKEHLARFQAVFPNYRKGSLPPDFISWGSLRQLKANLAHRIITPPSDDADCGDFAAFLIDALERAYPGRLNP